MKAYLLSLGSIVYNVSHDGWQQFSYVIYAGSERAISSSRARGLPSLACMF